MQRPALQAVSRTHTHPCVHTHTNQTSNPNMQTEFSLSSKAPHGSETTGLIIITGTDLVGLLGYAGTGLPYTLTAQSVTHTDSTVCHTH